MRHYWLRIALFFLLLLVTTITIAAFNLDLRIEHIFYQNGKWYATNQQPWHWFYKSGTVLPLLISVIALINMIGGIVTPTWRCWRQQAAFLLLTMLIGPGILVNAVFKDYWGRPRPRECTELGGKWEFQQVWQPGTPGRGHSFPSGHVATAWFLVAGCFILSRRKRYQHLTWLMAAIIYGVLMAFARMIQGAHFLSDALWGAGMTMLTAMIVYGFIFHKPLFIDKINRNIKKVFLTLLIGLLLLILMFAKPLYHETHFSRILPSDAHNIILLIHQTFGNIEIHIDKNAEATTGFVEITGTGFFERDVNSTISHNIVADTLILNSDNSVTGFFPRLTTNEHWELPTDIPLTVSAQTNKGDIRIFASPIVLENSKLNLSAPQGKIILIPIN
ncbi:phosphatase PAP2 family protein [candidate division KSB1 bacterium]|nr:phosphatase PAP2 family protein [candidate division KSB1 bacterium]